MVLDFLDEPPVAVRVAEREVRAVVGALGMEPGACPSAPKWKGSPTSTPRAGELGAGGLDIGHHEVQALVGAGLATS